MSKNNKTLEEKKNGNIGPGRVKALWRLRATVCQEL